MQVIGGSTYNPGNGNGTFSAGVATQGGVVILHNLSPYDVLLTFNNDPTRQGLLHAWQPRKFDFCGVQTLTIEYSVQNAPSQSIINAAPSSYIWGESFAVGETIPESLPNYDRLSNLGNSAVLNTATNVVEQDLLTPTNVSDMVASKDGTVASQLDVTAGVALLKQSDSSLLRIATTSTSFAIQRPSATYYLDLNPDGTFSFGLTHSSQLNYITIAQVTTDASGNVLTVTDLRTFYSQFLSGRVMLQVGAIALAETSVDNGKTTDARILNFITSNAVVYKTQQSGSAQAHAFGVWDGATLRVPLNIGQNGIGASTSIDNNGIFSKIAGQATAGNFGVTAIVAQVIAAHITTTAAQTILTFTPATTGLYRFNGSLWSVPGGTLTLSVTYKEGNTGTARTEYGLTAGGVGLNSAIVGPGLATGDPLSFGFYAQGGQPITVIYSNTQGTPNDYVTVILERMS